MLVYLNHPKHGIHIAYSQAEVDECLANGWHLKPEKKQEPQPQEIKRLGRPPKADK